MGYRGTWIGVKHGALESVLRTLGLRIAAEVEEPIYDPGMYAVNLPDWLVVFGDGSDAFLTLEAEDARRLSAGTQAVFFTTSDTTMCASIASYSDGEEVWSLDYEPTEERTPPTVDGDAPELVRDTVRAVEREQSEADPDVDYLYEAAPRIGLSLCGFRHDETLASGEHLPVFVLER